MRQKNEWLYWALGLVGAIVAAIGVGECCVGCDRAVPAVTPDDLAFAYETHACIDAGTRAEYDVCRDAVERRFDGGAE